MKTKLKQFAINFAFVFFSLSFIWGVVKGATWVMSTVPDAFVPLVGIAFVSLVMTIGFTMSDL